jgi:Flp pilus assembly protein TadG
MLNGAKGKMNQSTPVSSPATGAEKDSGLACTRLALRSRDALARFRKSRHGNIAIITGLMLPVLLGFAALGTEGGLWYFTHQSEQAAADSAAISAATLYGETNTGDITTQAKGVTATYGFTDGSNSTAVTVNRPPTSGTHTNAQNAVEVKVSQVQTRLLSQLWDTSTLTITARAVALASGGAGCVLALDPTASGSAGEQGVVGIDLKACSVYDNSNSGSAVSVGGTASLDALSVNVVGGVYGSANITTTDGINTGQTPAQDPYANVNPPSPSSSCSQTNYSTHGTVTLDPGVYCGGINLGAGANVTLNPGTYYLTNQGNNNLGDLVMDGQSSLSGTGVTIVFTSKGSNYGSAKISGGATVNLSAPTSGPLSGIVFFGDRNEPTGTVFKITGGTSQTFTGAIYLPKAALQYAGGANNFSGCTQVIADTITFVGSSNLAINCTGDGIQQIGNTAARLVE